MDVAIIGAGLSGLTAARELRDAGHAPVLFDKSRGLGGRLASRRRDGWVFDHGAPGADPADSDLGPYLDRATRDGAAALGGDAPNSHRGLPWMSAIVRPLAEGLKIRREAEVARVLRRGDGFVLRDATDEDMGVFSHVICAVPAPQAARLLAGVLSEAAARRLEAVLMDPCWTLMAGWSDPPGPPRDGPGTPFQSVVRQDHARPVWVAHATPAWSRAHLELSRDEARDHLEDALMAHLGTTTRPDIAMAHRWRFARTATPLGCPCLAQADERLLIGGDWTLGPQAGHAYASGQAMGRMLNGTLRQTPDV